MIRKQIYITPQQDRELSIKARSEGKSVAEVIRSLLDENLVTENQETGGEFLLRLASKAVKGKHKNVSSHMFDYLYGDKSPKYGKSKPKLTKQEIEHINRFIDERSQENSS